MPTTLTLTGTLIDHTSKQSLASLEVQIWSTKTGSKAPLNTVRTDASGQFVAQLKVDGVQRSVKFKVLQNGRQLKLAKDEIVWGGRGAERTVTIPVLDATITPEEPEEPDHSGSCVVRGHVLNANGPAIAQATVKAVHKKLRSEIDLGRAITDKSGAYEIKYSVPQGEDHADLILRVQNSKDEQIATSQLICHATKEETVDLVVGGDEFVGFSEYEELVDAVSSHLDGAAPESLSASDVSVLACKTQLDSVQIAYYVVAVRNAATTGVTAAAFYGFSRMRLPTQLSALLRQATTVKRRALESALSSNIIPANLASSIDGIIASLQSATVKLALVEPQDDSTPSLTGLLGTAGLSQDEQENLLLRYVQYEGANEEFWTALKQDQNLSAKVADLQLSLQLGLLTGYHLPLVTALQARKQAGQMQSLKDLVSLDAAEWTTIIEATGVPALISGGSEADRVRTYAETIVGLLERAFPTTKVVTGFVKAARSEDEDVCRFFQNSPEFEFTTNIDCYLRDNPGVLADIKDTDKLRTDLRRWQRCYKLAPTERRYEAMVALDKDGFTSALSIVRKGKTGFVNALAGALNGTEVATTRRARSAAPSLSNTATASATATAEIVYARAEKIATAAMVLQANYHTSFNRAQPFAVGTIASGNGSVDIPNWEELFGSLDCCECADCRSIYSPSAYLVDLLQFLDNSDNYASDSEKSPRDLLLERRPDLEEIQLSCANSDTELPYISLVLEILERAVAGGTSTTGTTMPQTTWTAEELSASDEHFDSDAYTPLAVAVYPWSLPFNLWLVEARTYLGHLGVSLAELMDVFQRKGLDDNSSMEPEELDKEIAAESLDISPVERRIIIGAALSPDFLTDEPASEDFWGGKSESDLSVLATFLSQAELDYSEAEELFATRFVDLDLPAPTECSIEGLTISGLDASSLSRIHRFVRLQRKLDWEIRELDEALTAMGASDFTDTFLIQLADISALREEFDVPLLEALAWSSNLSTSVDAQDEDVRSLYEQLFLNKTVIDPESEEAGYFALNTDRTDIAGTAETLEAHTATILAGLQITEEELSLIKDFEKLTDPAAKLNLSTLSQLYRNVSLAKALDLEIEDFLSVRVLTGLNPFTPGDTGATRDFVEQAQAITESDFSVAELDYLLRHAYEETEGVAPTESTTLLFLDEVRDSLQKISDENQFVSDPVGEVTQGRLAVLLTADDLARAIAIIEGTSSETEANQQSFVGEQFASFLEDLEEAKSTLVGPVDLTSNPTQVQDRYEYVLQPLVEYLRETLSRQLVYQKTADTFGLDVDVATALASTYVKLPGDADLIPALSGTLEFSGDADGTVTKEHLAALLDEDDVATAMAILEGASDLNETDQQAFIDTKFSVFITNISEAKANLVGSAALAAGQARYEYVLEALLTYLKTILLDWYVLLHKIALLLSRFEVTSSELPRLFEKRPDGWLDLAALPLDPDENAAGIAARFAGWRRILDLFNFRSSHEAGDTTVFTLLDEISAEASQGDVLETLATLTNWDLEELAALTGWNVETSSAVTATDTPALLKYPDDFQDAQFLVRLEEAFMLLNRLGMSAETVYNWQISDLSEMQVTATAIKNAVKAKYDSEKWLEVAEPLKDELREKQRDALVVWLISKNDFEDTTGLYDHYLIDVEMNACMQTSRIKQALCSIQLFVQRSLMNLEQGVELTETAAEQWEWMKAYRVWEANRKVFVYPENWIEPELRDDKSPFFEDLENELLQNDVTDATAETAFLNYLEKLNQVANLEVCAVYHQKEEEDDQTIDVVHVVARTFGTPPVYYYRQFIDGSYWTAWERLDLDIEGDHHLLYVWNRRLYLFWPIFTEKAEETVPASASEPDKYWEIELAWTEYMNGTWSAKKIASDILTSTAKVIHDSALTLAVKSDYFFRAAIEADSSTEYEELVVTASVYETGGDLKYFFDFGEIRFSGADGGRSSAIFAYRYPLLPPSTNFLNLQIVEDGDAPFELKSAAVTENGEVEDTSDTDDLPILDLTPGEFRLTVPIQYNEFVGQDHFFYQDDRRAFFVSPEVVSESEYTSWLSSADRVGIGAYQALYESVNSNSRNLQLTPVLREQPGQTSARRDGRVSSGARVARSTGGMDDAHQIDEVATILDDDRLVSSSDLRRETRYGYLFRAFHHPYVSEFIKNLNRDGIDGFLQRDTQNLEEPDSFKDAYMPEDAVQAGEDDENYPDLKMDFAYDGAYSLYNWELFFHAPLLIADRLSQNQQFEEAQKWFHYIFNPTARTDGAAISGAERYWVFHPFYSLTAEDETTTSVYDLMQQIQDGDDTLLGLINQWRKDPFDPHLIARLRPVAYMKSVVIKYIDNLIAWGDSLFSQDTIEFINEATQLYLLASKILGDRPETLPESGTDDDKTYADLEDDLDAFSNAAIESENVVFDFSFAVSVFTFDFDISFSVGAPTLYFCIPENADLLERWTTVEDRLFKIRHCMNIEGVERSLALFEPPIDPAMLVQAAAAGADIGSVLSDVNAPLPYYRFQVMLQKAVDFCSDVRSLGSALLAALEKKDAEELAFLRATHESQLLEAVRILKEKQVDEAEKSKESLEKSKELAQARSDYYSSLSFMNTWEIVSMALNVASLLPQVSSGAAHAVAGISYLVPDFDAGASGVAASPVAKARYGGSNVGSAASAFAAVLAASAGILTTGAGMSATIASYQRRKDEWDFQKDLADKEIDQIDQQIVAAGVRVEIAQQDLENTEKQIEQAEAVYDFMKNKYTNQDLYSWMVTQISALYFQSYKLAYDLAKRAERCYQHELGVETSFVQFGYWDSLKKGLLAGERLQYDLRRIEASYLENNKRTFELTKHISLTQLDPIALLKLKQEGECYVSLPEAIFDLDYPGHYQRRIKSVSLTVPCVTGPYTSLSCTLTLLSSSIRTSTDADSADDYGRDVDSEDSRFRDLYGATQSIATSHGRQDAGLFELNLHDERYLPFEGTGVISQWRLQLPTDFKPFDYSTISDVILHFQYTAKDGGTNLKDAATNGLKNKDSLAGIGLGKDGDERTGLFRAFSLRHEFPNEWYRLLHPTDGTDSEVTLDLGTSRFPYRYQDKEITITAMEMYVKGTADALFYLAPPNKPVKDSSGAWLSDYKITFKDSGIKDVFSGAYEGTDQTIGDWTIAADEIQTISDQIEEMVLVFHFTAEAKE